MWVCSKEHPKYTSGEGMVGVDVAKQAPQVPLRPHSEGCWTGMGRGSSELPAAAHPGCPGGEHVALAARLPHPSNQEFLSGTLEVYVHTSTVFSSITSSQLKIHVPNAPESICCRLYTPGPSPACRASEHLPEPRRRSTNVPHSFVHSVIHHSIRRHKTTACTHNTQPFREGTERQPTSKGPVSS